MIINNILPAITSLQLPAYVLIFLAMILEGPLITISASFAASLGIFNIWIIFLLSLLGDLVGDFLHFGIGRFINKGFLRNSKIFGIKKGFKKIEKHMKKHLGKTIFFAKFTPPLATPALLLAGAGKVSLKRFVIISLLATLPRTILLIIIGYFFGSAYSNIARYIGAWQYLIILAAIFIIFAFLIYRLIINYYQRKLKIN